MFSRKIFVIIIILLLAAGVSITTIRCYDDDKDARVTIHLERNDLAAMGIQPQKHIIDRVLEFFSTRAEATTVPEWFDIRTDLTLTVTSTSFDDMTFTLPANAQTFTVNIPSGSETTFTVTSQTDWLNPINNIQKNWGGQYTTKLGPGDMKISITMIPMTYIITVDPPSTVTIDWAVYSISTVVPVSSYKIYRSTTIDGNYSLVSTTTSDTYTDPYSGTRYYYRISCVTARGEGVMSDPKTW